MGKLNCIRASLSTKLVLNQWFFVLIMLVTFSSEQTPRLRFVASGLLGIAAFTSTTTNGANPAAGEVNKPPFKPWIAWIWILIVIASATNEFLNAPT